MKKNLLLIILIITSMMANSQNCFWAKRAGGTNTEEGQNIATDLNGNVYVVGNNSGGSVTFGSTTLNGSYNFIVKYNASGTVKWAKTLGGEADGIVTDNAGNVYITGAYAGTKSFGSIILTSVAGGGDVFTAKIDTSGNFIWAKSAGGTGGDYSTSISTDGLGNIFITGNFTSDSMAFETTKFPNNGPYNTYDLFIAKYDAASGNFLWAKTFGDKREDMSYGITADGAGNSYITGAFRSDSLTFGTTTLYSNSPGGYVMYISKYDSTGNVLWAKGIEGLWGNVIAYDIKMDLTNNIYVAGEFQGVSVKFGNDSLINQSSGSSDVFVAKYDSNGNAIWARSGGGGNYDYSRHLSVDGIGNVYSIGEFASYSIYFENDSLNNSSTLNTFISKYSTSGTLQWLKNLGNVMGGDISAEMVDNVYFTGKFSGSTSLGNVTLTSAGQNDFFVADLFNFNSGIASSTNVTCYGGNDGSIITAASGGNIPYTYSWTTTPTQTTPDVSNLTAGSYSVTITEGYGCAQTANVTITEPPPSSAEICMVTVDTLSQHNIIIWDKTSFTTVDSFVVYREIGTNNYQPIAVVAFDSLSQFIDTVRTKYFPNTGDPNAGTYRYKIQTKSICGVSGPISAYHNTIYIINSGGTFSWPQLYTIEGGANPVTSYVLMRDDNSIGNWHAVNSVAGTQQTVSDPQFTTYQSTASWRIQTQWGINCTPTKSFNTSYSNSFTINTNAINEKTFDNLFTLFPNPSNGKFTLQYKSTNINRSKANVDVYNVVGEKIYSFLNETGDQFIIDLNSQSSGIYFLKLKTDNHVFTRKIIIQ